MDCLTVKERKDFAMEKERREAQRKVLQRCEKNQNNIKYLIANNWRQDAITKARLKKLAKYLENRERPTQTSNNPSDYKTIFIIVSVSLIMIFIYAL